MRAHELPLDRLSTTDEKGRRLYLYPADVRGRYRRLRTRLSALLIVVFLVLPWVRIGGHQAILLDVPGRRFAILGMTFWAHDAPMLVFVFGGSAILLAFVTSIWGRVWCGWACPQTVFVDHVFRRVERWIEGDAFVRRRIDNSPMSAKKFVKKTVKWAIFSALALVISHSLLAYFVGTEALRAMVASPPSENPGAFLAMAIVAAGVLFDFGWFREQFCTIVCPYGRFQSVLMDDRSRVVAYDRARGEPRRGGAAAGQKQGDCVNCYRCVQVCPTGIDIRRGVQLECIACTSCMDACDEVMSRIRKPAGLIRYDSAAVAQGVDPSKLALSRARSWVYGLLLIGFAAGLVLTLRMRVPVELELVRAVDAPYQEIPGAQGGIEIVNHFKADLRNQTFETRKLELALPAELKARGMTLVLSNHSAELAPGETERADVFVRFPKALLQFGHAAGAVKIIATADENGSRYEHTEEVRLVGPFQ